MMIDAYIERAELLAKRAKELRIKLDNELEQLQKYSSVETREERILRNAFICVSNACDELGFALDHLVKLK